MTDEKLQELMNKVETGYFCKKNCCNCGDRVYMHFCCIYVAENIEKELLNDD